MPERCGVVVELHVVGGQRHQAFKDDILHMAHDLAIWLDQRFKEPDVRHSSDVACTNSSDEGLDDLLADAATQLWIVTVDGDQGFVCLIEAISDLVIHPQIIKAHSKLAGSVVYLVDEVGNVAAHLDLVLSVSLAERLQEFVRRLLNGLDGFIRRITWHLEQLHDLGMRVEVA